MTSNTSLSSVMEPEKNASPIDGASEKDFDATDTNAAAPPLSHSTSPDNEKAGQGDVEQGVPEKPAGPPPGAFDPRQVCAC